MLTERGGGGEKETAAAALGDWFAHDFAFVEEFACEPDGADGRTCDHHAQCIARAIVDVIESPRKSIIRDPPLFPA